MASVGGFEVDAVLLDFDGVICDTEPMSNQAWLRTLESVGGDPRGVDVASLVGHTDREVAEAFSRMTGVDAARLEEAAREALLEMVAGGVEVFPDAERLLLRLEASGVGLAIASNSFRWRLDALVAGAGLDGRVPVVVAGDEVREPKPAPDVYLECARRLGAGPARCLVVEDSPTGIRAGRAAGMRVAAVERGMFEPGLLSGADLVVPTLDSL